MFFAKVLGDLKSCTFNEAVRWAKVVASAVADFVCVLFFDKWAWVVGRRDCRDIGAFGVVAWQNWEYEALN